jgi:NADH-quinone oxidoreductase subunit N
MFSQQAIDKLETSLIADLMAFSPELLVCTGIVVMLLLRLLPRLRLHMCGISLFFSGSALLLTAIHFWDVKIPLGGSSVALDFLGIVNPKDPPFSGLLVVDHFTGYLRIVLLGFAVLITWLSMLTGIPDEEDSADFYTLLLGGTLGMMLMASANHLLMVFIAVEMASLPSYALAGFMKGRRQSSEASLKYVVYGGGASGVMLYGISLLAGRFGTGYLPDVATGIHAECLKGGPGIAGIGGMDAVVLLGIVFILVGLAFKLSAVPFHFWCPDVFEGAAAEVGAFLSVASKAAAMALTARLLLVLAGTADLGEASFLMTTKIKPEELTELMQKAIGPVVAFFAAITATFGNLAAYPQTNLKRLLAYSTIAHAGYMLMGLAVMNADGAKAVLFYLFAYIFMNLGAFAVVAFLRNKTGSEDLKDFRGLVYRSPLLVVLLGVFLLSLLGLPPLVGFAAKFQVFSVLFDAGQHHAHAGNSTLSYVYYGLLIIGGINTVISTVYYLKVLKVMVLERPLEELEGRPAVPLRLSIGAVIFSLLLGLSIFVGGILWNPIAEASDRGAQDFRRAAKSSLPTQPPVGMGAGGGGGARPGGPPPGGPRPGGGPPFRAAPSEARP